jgi:hypothetical protein
MIDIDRTLALAKRGELSKSELYARMQSIAEERRGLGESTAQSFTRFIASDEGREMFAIQKAMTGRDIEPAPIAATVEKREDTGWDQLIRAMKRANPGMLTCTAINEALKTEGGRFAFAQAKRAQQIATGQFTQADMACLDQIAGDHDREMSKRDQHGLKTDYEKECEDVQRMYPHMKASAVHDHVRSKNPELWAEHKKISKLGSHLGDLPQPRGQRERSGEEPPKATSGRSGREGSQWESGHSHSDPTTPDREPGPEDQSPTVKALVRVMKRLGERDWSPTSLKGFEIVIDSLRRGL